MVKPIMIQKQYRAKIYTVLNSSVEPEPKRYVVHEEYKTDAM